jgi:hypothetical protein
VTWRQYPQHPKKEHGRFFVLPEIDDSHLLRQWHSSLGGNLVGKSSLDWLIGSENARSSGIFVVRCFHTSHGRMDREQPHKSRANKQELAGSAMVLVEYRPRDIQAAEEVPAGDEWRSSVADGSRQKSEQLEVELGKNQGDCQNFDPVSC